MFGVYTCGMDENIKHKDFEEWLKIGIDQGFCGPSVCSTHDGIPMNREEEEEFETGSDPCVHILRLYYTPEHKAQVEENHSPSIWRNQWRN